MRRLLLSMPLLLAACGGEQAVQLPERELRMESDCLVHERACEALGDGVRLGLRLGEGELKGLAPFPVALKLEGIEATAVSLEFSMPGMDMGQNRYHLLADDAGLWRGEAMLPICSTGRLEWLAEVVVDTADERLRADFPFHTLP